MKKIFCFLTIAFGILFNINIANAVENPTGITFIYINGSNNLAYNNRLKFKTAFIDSVNKLHPQIKKRFEEDELINKLVLRNGEYKINPEPITFYWGDRSLKVVETLDRDLKSASKYSPRIAHQARSIFAHCLHDAVWVQKPQNMISVLDDLHKVVNSEIAKGNKVVLLGYSAGSFVTYQYYMNKSDYRVNEFLLLELIPLVFNTYGLKEELPMYIAGISMGGYGSLLIGSAFPSEFKKIVSISGAFIAHDVAIGNPQVVGGLGDKEALKYFTDTFAPFDTLENDIYRNPVAAIIDCNCNEDVVPELIITCGTKDELYARNLDVLRTFCKYGVAYDWLPIEGGIHDYKSFDAGLRYAFKMLEE